MNEIRNITISEGWRLQRERIGWRQDILIGSRRVSERHADMRNPRLSPVDPRMFRV